jgi:hypothetical protein
MARGRREHIRRAGRGPARMKARCCRSTPRCSGCPVLVKARSSAATAQPATAAVIAEVFTGRDPRTLPAGVVAALERLEAARAGPPTSHARA